MHINEAITKLENQLKLLRAAKEILEVNGGPERRTVAPKRIYQKHGKMTAQSLETALTMNKEGKSAREIARVIGVHSTTVGFHLRRAKTQAPKIDESTLP